MESLRVQISNLIKEVFSEQEAFGKKQRPKAKAVRFNSGLENEYIVTFSERGFLIDDTRLSFEEIETALSKEYAITLKGGKVLDAVKMQQILKYKDLF